MLILPTSTGDPPNSEPPTLSPEMNGVWIRYVWMGVKKRILETANIHQPIDKNATLQTKNRLVVSTHLKNMLAKLNHFPSDRGEKRNIWVATTQFNTQVIQSAFFGMVKWSF